jgi:CheY-like chemotaxis protein
MHKVLIIEDNLDMALAIAMPLEASGYQLAFAASGQEGLAQICDLAPDLIILDVTVETAVTDFQVSLVLRSSDEQSPYAPFRDIPILLLTSAQTTTALRLGPDEICLPVDDFVEKPVDADILLEKVGELLVGR